MKNQTLIIVGFLVILSCFGAQAAIGYDYCGKPCNDPPGMICAYNQVCYEIFMNKCEMKKSNCDLDNRFNEQPMSTCLLGRKC